MNRDVFLQSCLIQILKSLVNKCLKQADKLQCQTIAFPVLGTGVLGYPSPLVAKTMYQAVEEYGQKHPDTIVRIVRFVVWHEDNLALKVMTFITISMFSTLKHTG